MPTRNISLTREQDALVEELVDSGDYQNASEAIRDALRVLQQRRREDKLKLQALRAQLKVGPATPRTTTHRRTTSFAGISRAGGSR